MVLLLKEQFRLGMETLLNPIYLLEHILINKRLSKSSHWVGFTNHPIGDFLNRD